MNGPIFPKTKISLYVGEFLATLILRICYYPAKWLKTVEI